MHAKLVCPHCRFTNVARAKFCGDCGWPLDSGGVPVSISMSTAARQELTDPTPPNLRALENVADELDKLWEDFYKIRENNKEGGFLWELILKHVAAHDLNVKVDNVKGQIEGMWLDGYLQSHNLPIQRILALQAQQIAQEHEQYDLQHQQRLDAQRFEFNQQLRDEALKRELQRRQAAHRIAQQMADTAMVGRVVRFDKLIKSIEDLLIEDGPLTAQDAQSQDMKREIILELLHLAKDIIFDKNQKGNDYSSYLDELDDLVDL